MSARLVVIFEESCQLLPKIETGAKMFTHRIADSSSEPIVKSLVISKIEALLL